MRAGGPRRERGADVRFEQARHRFRVRLDPRDLVQSERLRVPVQALLPVRATCVYTSRFAGSTWHPNWGASDKTASVAVGRTHAPDREQPLNEIVPVLQLVPIVPQLVLQLCAFRPPRFRRLPVFEKPRVQVCARVLFLGWIGERVLEQEIEDVAREQTAVVAVGERDLTTRRFRSKVGPPLRSGARRWSDHVGRRVQPLSGQERQRRRRASHERTEKRRDDVLRVRVGGAYKRAY